MCVDFFWVENGKIDVIVEVMVEVMVEVTADVIVALGAQRIGWASDGYAKLSFVGIEYVGGRRFRCTMVYYGALDWRIPPVDCDTGVVVSTTTLFPVPNMKRGLVKLKD